jgi:membrane-bound lytic murein transglycosylase B
MPTRRFHPFHAFCLAGALGLALLLGAGNSWARGMADRPEVQDFIQAMADAHGFDAATLNSLFADIDSNARVLRLIAPPDSPRQRSWQRYRSRFLDAAHIRRGVDFWQENAATLARARAFYGVPEEIIVAILGIETFYGRNTGNFRTIEALATLAFDAPRRSDFFRAELEQFLLLCRENDMDPAGLRGSFAGALGLPQFMPGSQRRYAVDFDGDGRIDLRNSTADAIGSVAHFLAQHGWQTGAPVAVPAKLAQAPDPAWLEAGIRPTLAAESLQQQGIESAAGVPGKVAFIELETPDAASEYWLGHENFYVLTRYNRSSFYAMSVFQLSEALADARRARQQAGLAAPAAAR